MKLNLVGITKKSISNGPIAFQENDRKSWPQEKVLEEFDRSLPKEEPYINKQPLTTKSQAKPSLLSRDKIQRMIPYLPDFIQKDMEILVQNTLQNLDSFNAIHNFKQILDQEDAMLYQDTNDNLHMKFIYYSKIKPLRIYHEHVMPSTSRLIQQIKSFQVYPTKNGCSLVYAELQLGETSCNILQNQDLPIHMINNEIIRIVFTQKGFEKDGIYCIFRKYSQSEQYYIQLDIYHDQIDHSLAEQLDQYNKQDYKSLLIEDIYFECKDRDAGEKMIKVFQCISHRVIEIQSKFKNKSNIQMKTQSLRIMRVLMHFKFQLNLEDNI
ncbi:unnamed protein product (macronuclear) [Paramecium tetraurelia]|uniref:Uncharacterized protein n=1 Tax=Paramecium tetraurelia TaxID=5888 RepID=A0E2J2_PARTE|nr:uncharacterized protein GSPATT00022681001 [Paramecium tetraurelia]CAK89509.1 unnamed protein product [Paramecium tetraurelia]|eukprot:XP_001456906.1 hypothetical protein (macronuclear) [Paramecium tetraurelia strain d4-2]